MKRIASLILAFILSFSMVGCGGIPGGNPPWVSSTDSSYSSEEDISSEYSSEEESEEEESIEEESEEEESEEESFEEESEEEVSSEEESSEESASSEEEGSEESASNEEESSSIEESSEEENSEEISSEEESSEEESSEEESASSDEESSIEEESSSIEESSDESYTEEESSSEESSEESSKEEESVEDSSEVLFFDNGMPNYNAHSADELILNAWYAPETTKEAYQLFKDCGFNRMFLMGHNVGYIGLDSSQNPTFKENMEKALTYCDELGLKVYLDVSDCAVNGVSAAAGKKAVLAVIEKYKNHPSFAGVCYDEPVINTNTLNKRWGVTEMSPVIQEMATKYPGEEFVINSNPSTNCIYPWGTSSFTYEEYWEAQLSNINAHFKGTDTPNWLSADDYPLYIDSAGNKFLKEEWLECMAYIAVVKRDNADMNLKTNFFLQSIPFENNRQFMRNRTPSYEDLRLQMYTLMAFGYDSLSFFCYATPPAVTNGDFTTEQVGLVDRSGAPTATYNASKKVIGEVKNFANTYMQFNGGWKGAYTILGTNTSSRVDFDYLNRIGNGTDTKRMKSAKIDNTWIRAKGLKSMSATEDTVVGCMEDQWGNPGLMVVNYNDTSKQKTSQVNIRFDVTKYNKAWVYIDGVQNEVPLTSGKLTLNLGVGEGVFVIPVKK